jgi:hypothetical protein
VSSPNIFCTDERDQLIVDGWRRCATGQRSTQFCGLLEAAVLAEREACAKMCETMKWCDEGKFFAHLIRARGDLP